MAIISTPHGQCTHYEVCHRADAQHVFQDRLYCVMHYPDAEHKSAAEFSERFTAFINSGRCDFRYIVFPKDNASIEFADRTFEDILDLRGLRFSHTLNLRNAVLKKGLLFSGAIIKAVDMVGARVHGPVDIRLESGHVYMDSTLIDGAVTINAEKTLSFRAEPATFAQLVVLDAHFLNFLLIGNAKFLGGLKIRARISTALPSDERVRIKNATFHRDLDLANCLWSLPLDFHAVTFDADLILNLSHTQIDSELALAGLPAVPKEVWLNGTVASGRVEIRARPGTPPIRLLAADEAPRFEGDRIIFENVDLSRCRLLGNVFEQLEVADVHWHRRRSGLSSRRALYDESVLGPETHVAVRRLRAAYQVLKERYRSLGDNVRASDFHYGEMEMRRREYDSTLQRYLWPEAWYCLVSGYGTRPLRAFLLWVLLVLVFAAGFAIADPHTFGWLKALEYSLAVATLQRPELPASLSETARWLYRVEAILCPVQAALFGLALRTRLKR